VTIITLNFARLGHNCAINDAATRGRPMEPKMTTLRTRTIRKAGLVLAVAVSIATLGSTSSFAFSSEAQQMCTGDAFRLCSSEIPNIPKITACMIKNRSNLSTGCRAVMDKEAAALKSSKVASE
jgi:hypothetical protein